MAWKCHIRSWLWLELALLGSSIGASAMPAPIARMGTASKSVLQKTFDGAKTVAKVPVHAVKYGVVGAKDVVVDVGVGAKDVGASVVHHVRSI